MQSNLNSKPVDRARRGALFNNGDYLILHQAISKLPRLQQRLVTMRYWEGLSVTEIAMALRLSWATTISKLQDAQATLRRHCLNDPTFSRAISAKIAA